MISPHLKRMQIARSTLLLDEPFFGVLSLGLDLVEDATCKTAWTDGRSIGYSPAFLDTLTPDQLTAVVAHEVMHCACGHPWRRDGREHQKWNVAADYAINSILTEAHFKLPSCALLSDQYKGKWAEWIYDRLPDSQGDGSGSGNGTGQSDPSQLGEVRDAPADATAPTEADWQQATQQAVRAAQGKLPASLKRDISDATRARQDWRSLLRRYIQEVTRSDYSWSHPNVRYIPSGLYLPALHSHACGPIVVAVDTSGSIDTVLLSQFAGEIRAICDEVQPASVEVVYCDAAVNRVDHFERGDYVDLQACGGGGTSFAPVFARVETDGLQPAVLIYLTDMYGSFPDQAPEYPVIWASYSTVDTAPFGDVVTCE